MRINIILLV